MSSPHRASTRRITGFPEPFWPLDAPSVAYPGGIGRKTAPTAYPSPSFCQPTEP